MKVIILWNKGLWMSNMEIMKNLKVLYHTCLSFDAELTVVDLDQSIGATKIGFSFPILSEMPDLANIVLLEPENAVGEQKSCDLRDFVHENDATYVIGANYGQMARKCGKNVKLVHIKYSDVHPLWQDVALGILLYDRSIK